MSRKINKRKELIDSYLLKNKLLKSDIYDNKLKMSTDTFYRFYNNGKVRIETLVKFAELLNVSIEELL